LDQRVSEGTKVPVYIYENPDFRLPDDDLTPIIMVGPGTGVAPFRAFLQQRIQSNATCGENILFFGSRRRDQDFLYGDELTQWQESGKLSLITAFSREQDEKVYVQHRLREHGELVWRTLEKGGHFYICGDGEYMSKAVESALLSVIESHQGKGMEAAEEYVKSLVASKRLQKDVWIS
jgi:sulfite reductase (NADPH) flavoprotein alpha-component